MFLPAWLWFPAVSAGGAPPPEGLPPVLDEVAR